MISFNFNDNAYFQSSGVSALKDFLMPIVCVLLGVAIGEFINYRRKSKETKEVGENFTIELNLIHSAISEHHREYPLESPPGAAGSFSSHAYSLLALGFGNQSR